MHSATPKGYFWASRIAWLGMGGLLFLGGYLTALWAPLHRAALTMPAQAADNDLRGEYDRRQQQQSESLTGHQLPRRSQIDAAHHHANRKRRQYDFQQDKAPR